MDRPKKKKKKSVRTYSSDLNLNNFITFLQNES